MTMIGFHAVELIFGISNLLIILLVMFVIVLLVILGTLFWIWTLIDCATKEPSEGNDKVIWILVIILTSFIGALIYYFVRRPERKRLLGR